MFKRVMHDWLKISLNRAAFEQAHMHLNTTIGN